MTVRIAAMGDVHFGLDSHGCLLPHLARLGEQADLLLVAGDITRHGDAREAAVFAQELADIDLPKFVVLGNHDYHMDQHEQVAEALQRGGFTVLEGAASRVDVNGTSVGIVGDKGFGGGFEGACGTYFGESEMKSFIGHTREISARLHDLLEGLDTDLRVVLLHYSPAEGTVRGERLEIFPFLGSYLLGEAIDTAGADIVFHGHAHAGTEKGITPGGVHVRNVAQHVIKQAYAIYSVSPTARTHADPRRALAADGESAGDVATQLTPTG